MWAMDVWLNGQFVDRDQATISVADAGFQHGLGLFETMQAKNGRLFRSRQHLERLVDSARDLMLTERLHIDPLLEAVQLAVTHNNLDSARVRLTLTGGNLNLLKRSGQRVVDPTILIDPQPPTIYPEEFFTKGIMVMIADGRVNPFDPLAGHKTLNYWPRIQSLQIAAGRGAGEVLWFSVSNHLASGSVSNVFYVDQGTLHTPIARGEEESGALPAPVLPGITRQTIIELAQHMNIGCARHMVDIDDVLEADEVFLTNSSWGVLPVVGIEQQAIADGNVGKITQRLREAWLQLVDEETSA